MRKVLLAFITFILCAGLHAQGIKVTGTVIGSSDKAPIPGVTIQVKGTQTGTITDVNGKYSIDAAQDGILVFSYIGMETQEVSVNNQAVINVVMNDMAYNLGEYVVVGYTSESRKLVSASVSTVKVENLKAIPIKTIDGVLQGQSPGLQVTQNSGTPGGAMTVRIRGNSSINAGNQPLFVIDGIPVTTGNFSNVSMGGQGINALSDINPNDIESITVLKDASATAIYGARGANGVVLITTKRGAAGKNSLDVSMSYGVQMFPKERKLDMMDANEWRQYKNLSTAPEHNTDWLEEVFRAAPTSNLEVSLKGGNNNTRYFLSGTAYQQNGVLIGTAFQRASGRLNLDHKLNEKVSFGASISLSSSKNDRVESDQSLYGVLPNAISIPAIFPVYNPDGTYNEDHFYSNPIANATEAINQAFTVRTIGNIFADVKILPELNFHTKWSTDLYSLREHSFDPPTTRQGSRYNGLGIEAFANVSNIVANNLLTYKKTFAEKHNLDLLLGQSLELYKRRSSYIEGIGFPSANFEYLESAAEIREARASATDRALMSYFTQVKYNYDYKYIIGLTARVDGSSKFSKNYKYGLFPAASLAWRVSEESFLNDNPYISDLKLKAGVGLTGNDGIGDFGSLNLVSSGGNYNGQPGFYTSQIGSENLRWESTFQLSGGFELGLLKDRITLAAEFYNNKTYDLLFYRPLPPSSGFTSIAENVGKMENKGFELDVTTVNWDKKLTWKTMFNFSVNRNKITKLQGGGDVTNGRGNNLLREGEPMNLFYGLNYLGVDPSTGICVYEDVNGDNLTNDLDFVITGDPNPKFSGGLTNMVTYKNLELTVFAQFTYGNDVYNGNRLYIEASPTEDNQLASVLDRWQQPGDRTDIPRVGDGERWTSRFIEDGSYLKIKNISLSYTFDKELTSRLKIGNARVYVAVQNALMLTRYSGMDPEVNYAGESNTVQGTDFFTYPQARTFTAGLSLNF